MAGNKNLHAAKEARKDEFYTQMQDIANELRHYAPHFRGKTVLCNCDDPYESNFFKYFALKFNELGLRKLICTCYDGSPIMQTELVFPDDEVCEGEREKKAYKLELTEVKDLTGDGAADLDDVRLFLEKNPPTLLRGNGDFRSPECVELLREADIVVTNPPFSLFREYVAQLVEYDKKFLIIGNSNAITYKEIFPLIKENKLWLGVTRHGTGSMWFFIPKDAPEKVGQKIVDGVRMQTIGSSAWFTNLDHNKRHYPLDLYKRYTPEEYPKYDNYDAIEVAHTSDIPCDYDGVMGVPITFLGKYCPEQFEIVGMAKRGAGDPALRAKVYTKEEYPNYSDLNAGPTLFDGNGILYNTYPRILIRKIKH